MIEQLFIDHPLPWRLIENTNTRYFFVTDCYNPMFGTIVDNNNKKVLVVDNREYYENLMNLVNFFNTMWWKSKEV